MAATRSSASHHQPLGRNMRQGDDRHDQDDHAVREFLVAQRLPSREGTLRHVRIGIVQRQRPERHKHHGQEDGHADRRSSRNCASARKNVPEEHHLDQLLERGVGRGLQQRVRRHVERVGPQAEHEGRGLAQNAMGRARARGRPRPPRSTRCRRRGCGRRGGCPDPRKIRPQISPSRTIAKDLAERVTVNGPIGTGGGRPFHQYSPGPRVIRPTFRVPTHLPLISTECVNAFLMMAVAETLQGSRDHFLTKPVNPP
jgi:hypothetical protein